MKPAINKSLKTQIPTPLMGTYRLTLQTLDNQMIKVDAEIDGTKRSMILPAIISDDWMKYMKEQPVTVIFNAAKTQTELIIQDRVGYIDNKRVYVNSKTSFPRILIG
jgi:hypothetical protein